MFIMMGLSAVFPVIHGLRMYGYAQMERQIGLSWVVSQGALYILGALIYAVSSPFHLSSFVPSFPTHLLRAPKIKARCGRKPPL